MRRSLPLLLLILAILPIGADAQQVQTQRITYGVRPDDFDRAQHPVDIPARLAAPLETDYPDQAVRRHLEGVAVIAAAIDRDGTLLYAEVRKSSGHRMLDSAAMLAVRGAVFNAAKRDGAPVPSRLTVPVEFRLGTDESWELDKTDQELRDERREIEKVKKSVDDERARIDEEIRRLKSRQAKVDSARSLPPDSAAIPPSRHVKKR